MRIAVIGAAPEIAGFGLAGALLYPAEDVRQARAAWLTLPSEVEIVILTAASAHALQDQIGLPGSPMTTVVPQ